MRARTLLIATLALLCLLPAGSAAAAKSKFTIRGAGFGHGVGMSQYGAYGFALNGSGYRDILTHYYSGTAIGGVDPNRRVRVLLQSTGTASFTGATRAGRRRVSPRRPTTCAAAAPRSSCSPPAASAWRPTPRCA